LKINILQGNVATQLRCDGLFNNHVIANFSHSVPVKRFWNRSIFGTFYGPQCMCDSPCLVATVIFSISPFPRCIIIQGTVNTNTYSMLHGDFRLVVVVVIFVEVYGW